MEGDRKADGALACTASVALVEPQRNPLARLIEAPLRPRADTHRALASPGDRAAWIRERQHVALATELNGNRRDVVLGPTSEQCTFAIGRKLIVGVGALPES